MHKNMMVVTTCLVLIVLAVTGCVSLNGASQPSLANTNWVLESYGPTGSPTKTIPDSQITLQFDGEGSAGGSSGCNSYGGKYQQENNQVTFREVVSTLMACVDAGVMEQEQQYLGALQDTGTFEISGDKLTISYNNGQGALNFNRAPGE